MNRRLLVGVDEVGRGPLAGPVTVCCVRIVPEAYDDLVKATKEIRGKDSKRLSPEARHVWDLRIREFSCRGMLTFGFGSSSARTIDRIGVTASLRQAVGIALRRVGVTQGERVDLDGSLKAPHRFARQESHVRGDERILAIGLASILAKVHRDRYMVRLDRRYPGYGFAEHKGYGTSYHRRAIARYGLSPEHRRRFCRYFT